MLDSSNTEGAIEVTKFSLRVSRELSGIITGRGFTEPTAPEMGLALQPFD